MANISQKNGVYVARFRLRGREYKKSLKTSDRRAAELGKSQVELTIHRLTLGLIAVPPGVDPGDFVVSGGTLTAADVAVEAPPPSPVAWEAAAEYLRNLGHLADTTRRTCSVHLNNFLRGLGKGAGQPVDRVTRGRLDDHLQARLRDCSRDTVKKERSTLLGFFAWCERRGYVPASPTDGLLRVTGGGDAGKFLTLAEVRAVVERGGLPREQEWALWDRLYLSPPEIAEVLALVKRSSRRGVSYLCHAIPAYTGMRRGEVLRLRWDDVEFGQDVVVARSRKQSRQEAETARRIDLHPELREMLHDWQKQRPRGQYVVCDEAAIDPLARHQAEERFWQPLKGTDWVIPERSNRPKIGFHTYRHSFASNLAAAGVDARVIDEFMGHQTAAMRKRYSHCFPKARRSAIVSFSLAAGPVPEGR